MLVTKAQREQSIFILGRAVADATLWLTRFHTLPVTIRPPDCILVDGQLRQGVEECNDTCRAQIQTKLLSHNTDTMCEERTSVLKNSESPQQSTFGLQKLSINKEHLMSQTHQYEHFSTRWYVSPAMRWRVRQPAVNYGFYLVHAHFC